MSQEPNNIDATIADLEGWALRIAAAIETLKYFRSQGGALPSTPSAVEGERVSLNGDISHDTFFQMTVADAAEKYLAMTKKTKRIPELANALLKGGVKSSSKKFPDMLRIMIRRDPRFVNVSSEWGLREWYPGMRRGPQRSLSTQGHDASATSERSTEPKTPIRTAPAKQAGQSIGNRALKLLNSRPSHAFTPAEVAEQLGEGKPSVTTSLCGLVTNKQIARPEKGKYQALKQA
jgi:hypothetical protein